MRVILALSILLVACNSPKTIVNEEDLMKEYEVSGRIQLKSKYCGGARPSRAILDQYKKAKPFSDFDLYLRKGSENSTSAMVLRITKTDSMGRFKFMAPPGEYVLISQDQLDMDIVHNKAKLNDLEIKDQKCLDKWFKKGMKQLTVQNKDITDIDLLIKRKCNIPDGIPCLKYTGKIKP